MFKLHANTVIFCQLRMLKLMYLKYCHFDKGSCTFMLKVYVDINNSHCSHYVRKVLSLTEPICFRGSEVERRINPAEKALKTLLCLSLLGGLSFLTFNKSILPSFIPQLS